MKNRIIILLTVVMLQACSTPRYSYYFSHEQYRYGQKKDLSITETSPLRVDPVVLEANAGNEVLMISKESVHDKVGTPPATPPTYTKAERRAIRAQLKKELKPVIAAEKKRAKEMATASGGMDRDLKFAAIFGAAGIVSLIIGGSVFNVLGGIALLIGLVFLIRYIIRQ